jgi:penicillin amidase
MQDCLYQAARDARDDLRLRLGQDMRQWQWERVHTMDFVSPIRREGLGRRLLGGGTHPMSGSGETLLRGRYDFNQPYAVCLPAALRMVADLNDAHKVVAVLPGGVSGRVFHPHAKDQVRSFMNGEKQYWWFSDEEIRAHARTELVLHP